MFTSLVSICSGLNPDWTARFAIANVPASAPVRTVDGEARYTVGVIGMFRSTHSEEFAQAVEKVRATAGMISAALGYRK